MHKKIMIILFTFFLLGCQTMETNPQVNKEKTATTTNGTEQDTQPPDQPKKIIDPTNLLTVHYIDVGQGDATLFHYKDEKEDYTILYDTGDWLGSEVVPYLQSQGISE